MTRGASWFAGAYGAWAASHAKMGRELRDGKPASDTPREGWERWDVLGGWGVSGREDVSVGGGS